MVVRVEGRVPSVPSGKTAGDGEPFIYNPSESWQIDKVKDSFLVGEKCECGFFCMFRQIQAFPEGKTGLHKCRLGEVHNESQSPQFLFFFLKEVFLHKKYIYYNIVKTTLASVKHCLQEMGHA